MRDIHKMCRICLGQGSRSIFEQTLGSTLLARDDLGRIAEKLRFVTMLKVNPKENLPQQICDLCIVQLNVSYNFKRLALKNDFQIRQYMIENGLNLMKEDDESNMETALEIHQIQHNVIRTNRFRQLAAPPEIRRNSTTSSVSGASTMLINGTNNSEAIAREATSTFVHPRPMVRPIQVKLEPIDPEEEQQKEPSPITSSPSNASEPSVITVSSEASKANRTTPMVQINGIINDESFEPKRLHKAPAPLSIKLSRSRKENSVALDKVKTRKLRGVQKSTEVRKSKRKVLKALKEVSKEAPPRKKKPPQPKYASNKKGQKSDPPRPRGRPPKDPNAPKMIYKTKSKKVKS